MTAPSPTSAHRVDTLSTDTNIRTVEGNDSRRRSTETKASPKTTELIVYLAAVVAVIVTSLVIGKGSNGGTDPFSAMDAIRYITYLTIGYMVARGLAKSGSREEYREGRDTHK